MYRNLKNALAPGTLALLGIASAANAQTLFSTGFEAPQYNLGALNGQNGWYGAVASVQSTIVKSGSLAGEFDALPAGGQSLLKHNVSYNADTNSNHLVHIQTDAYLTSNGSRPNWDVTALFGNAGFIGQIIVYPGSASSVDIAKLGGAVGVSVGAATVAVNQWNTYDLFMNYDTQIQTAYVNGTLIGSAPFASVSSSLNTIEIGQNSASQTSPATKMYFDNISVTATTPAPSSILVVLLGAVPLVGVLRRRRK